MGPSAEAHGNGLREPELVQLAWAGGAVIQVHRAGVAEW